MSALEHSQPTNDPLHSAPPEQRDIACNTTVGLRAAYRWWMRYWLRKQRCNDTEPTAQYRTDCFDRQTYTLKPLCMPGAPQQCLKHRCMHQHECTRMGRFNVSSCCYEPKRIAVLRINKVARRCMWRARTVRPHPPSQGWQCNYSLRMGQMCTRRMRWDELPPIAHRRSCLTLQRLLCDVFGCFRLVCSSMWSGLLVHHKKSNARWRCQRLITT